jgi:hypothetical protein
MRNIGLKHRLWSNLSYMDKIIYELYKIGFVIIQYG